jgi:hypothetical protein
MLLIPQKLFIVGRKNFRLAAVEEGLYGVERRGREDFSTRQRSWLSDLEGVLLLRGRHEL